MTQTVARRVVETGKRGSIINVSSDMGFVGGPDRTVLLPEQARHGGSYQIYGRDSGPHGIRVNTICPMFIETPLARRFLANEEFRTWILGRIKLGRIGQVEG